LNSAENYKKVWEIKSIFAHLLCFC